MNLSFIRSKYHLYNHDLYYFPIFSDVIINFLELSLYNLFTFSITN
jgi:hypothetical protein